MLSSQNWQGLQFQKSVDVLSTVAGSIGYLKRPMTFIFLLMTLVLSHVQLSHATCNVHLDYNNVLKGLGPHGEGWAIIPFQEVLNSKEALRLYGQLSAKVENMTNPDFRFWDKEKLLKITDEEIADKIMNFIEIQLALSHSIDGRKLKLYSAILRPDKGIKFVEGHQHDQGWITLTHSFLNTGSFVDSKSLGRLIVKQGETLIFTDGDRVSAEQLPFGPIFHGTPKFHGQRLILILNFFPLIK